MSIFLLSIRGHLAPSTLEAARAVHNATAGAPTSVAAAQSLGDLSHMVYVPAHGGHEGPGAGELLILDLWNSIDGLNQFFANEQVQEQAGRIFADRDPVVWAPAESFTRYHLPTPYGRNDRIVGVVRGQVRSRDEACARHNAIVGANQSKARLAGHVSHEAYFRLTPPDAPQSLEFFAVDVWSDAAGMGRFYEDPEFGRSLGEMFAAEPSTSVWAHPAGEWAEW